MKNLNNTVVRKGRAYNIDVVDAGRKFVVTANIDNDSFKFVQDAKRLIDGSDLVTWILFKNNTQVDSDSYSDYDFCGCDQIAINCMTKYVSKQDTNKRQKAIQQKLADKRVVRFN
jgi:hypothetical protein